MAICSSHLRARGFEGRRSIAYHFISECLLLRSEPLSQDADCFQGALKTLLVVLRRKKKNIKYIKYIVS